MDRTEVARIGRLRADRERRAGAAVGIEDEYSDACDTDEIPIMDDMGAIQHAIENGIYTTCFTREQYRRYLEIKQRSFMKMYAFYRKNHLPVNMDVAVGLIEQARRVGMKIEFDGVNSTGRLVDLRKK